MNSSLHTEDTKIEHIAQSILDNIRVSSEDALYLYTNASLYTLGMLAHHVRMSKHPESIVTFVADRNINYSNVCITGCKFCAFYRTPKHSEGYVLSFEEIGDKIKETIALGGTQVLLQGGHNPNLPFSYYIDLLTYISTHFPSIHIHAFSAPEIHFFAQNEGVDESIILQQLIDAGLDSIPGAGAEILVDSVREQIAPNKCSTKEWLGVMRKAHNLGLRTTATMMFGHKESVEDRIEHLHVLRELQDETGGFTAFIPWSFQPSNTRLEGFTAPSPEYLKTVALSRIMLDNFDNIQASWVTMGKNIAQLSLLYGVNDFGSLMIEENVVSAAGVSFRLSKEEIQQTILEIGFTPKQRTMDYSLLE